MSEFKDSIHMMRNTFIRDISKEVTLSLDTMANELFRAESIVKNRNAENTALEKERDELKTLVAELVAGLEVTVSLCEYNTNQDVEGYKALLSKAKHHIGEKNDV